MTFALGAVMSFTKTVAREMAPHGITVNSVAPGFIGTVITGNFVNDPDNVKMLLATIPANRIGTNEDVANAIGFLASEQAGYILQVKKSLLTVDLTSINIMYIVMIMFAHYHHFL